MEEIEDSQLVAEKLHADLDAFLDDLINFNKEPDSEYEESDAVNKMINHNWHRRHTV